MTHRNSITNARQLRKQQTAAEALLWSVLRGKQVCGVKFRRQHPEPPFILDLACVSKMLCVELDGEYHDTQPDKDLERETFLKKRGWTTIRFHNQDVLKDPEAVCIAIARHLQLEPEIKKRQGGLSSISDIRRILKDRRSRKLQD